MSCMGVWFYTRPSSVSLHAAYSVLASVAGQAPTAKHPDSKQASNNGPSRLAGPRSATRLSIAQQHAPAPLQESRKQVPHQTEAAAAIKRILHDCTSGGPFHTTIAPPRPASRSKWRCKPARARPCPPSAAPGPQQPCQAHTAPCQPGPHCSLARSSSTARRWPTAVWLHQPAAATAAQAPQQSRASRPGPTPQSCPPALSPSCARQLHQHDPSPHSRPGQHHQSNSRRP